MEFHSNEKIVGSFPKVSDMSILLFKVTGDEQGGSRKISTMCMKASPIKTLHELVSHQKISKEKLWKKDIQNHQVEDLEEIDNPQIED